MTHEFMWLLESPRIDNLTRTDNLTRVGQTFAVYWLQYPSNGSLLALHIDHS